MENPSKNNLLVSIVFGTIIAVVFVVLITIFGELVPPLKNFLKDQHYHHWVGKGIWTSILFTAGSLLFYILVLKKQYTNDHLAKWLTVLSFALILGGLILFAFFTYEYLVSH